MTTDLKIKNICPVIGMISSGKSSILNALFNMDYLEVTPEVTTKIVTIIRYNSSVTNPKFYKLQLKKEKNDDYSFHKINSSEIIGKEKIRDKIKNLNKELHQKEPKYEDIFYLLEIGQVNFIENEFLKNNDLADIPGVSENIKHENKNKEGEPAPNSSEYLTTEEKTKSFDSKKEINYLTQIFKILKNKMNNGIFIFSIDTFQRIDNYEIIGKLKMILNKPIENFLLLLNKMDKSENIEKDINKLNERLVEEFPNGGFNVTRNTIVQCSAFQLENELKMEKEFSNLLYYHYINYIMNSKNNTDFREYFKKFIENYIKKDVKEVENIDVDEFRKNIKSVEKDENIQKIINIIERIKQHHDTEKYKLLLDKEDFNKIDDSLDDLIEEDNKINLADQNNTSIIVLYYYYLYKNNKIKMYRSAETKTILEYFTMQNMNKKFKYKEIEQKLKELEDKDTLNKKINNVVTKMNEFYNIYQKGGIYLNQMDGVKNSIKPIINNLITSKYFYIPLIGVYNSGKSTILNDIIGYNLLPVKTGECTKKGILIKHWDNDIPIIRKAKFISENKGDKNDISYFEFNNDVIAEGENNVKQILNGINGNFIEKEEDFFYIINVRIKFLEYINDENLKEKICFVDLPGYGTKNKFELKDIYSKFIKSCKLFLMVARDQFDDKDIVEKINGLMIRTSQYQGISTQSLAKKILFIVNNSQNLDISEQSLQKKKMGLIKNIVGLSKGVNKDINITFFNGLYYQYYLEKKQYFSDLPYLFDYMQKKHQKDYERFRKGYIMSGCEKKLENYLLRNLKDDLKTIFGVNNINKKEVEIDQEINNTVNSIITQKKLSFKEKDLNDLKKIISYCKQNIDQCKYINESNFLNFRFYLYARITICKYESDNELRKLVDNNLDNLNKIFFERDDLKTGKKPVYKEITNKAEEQLSTFKSNITEKLKDFRLGITDYNVPKVLEESITEINKVLSELKDKIEEKLKHKKWKEIQNEFEQKFQSTVEEQKITIINTLEKCSDKLKAHYVNAFKIINGFKINLDKDEYDELKIYISNKLGEKNNYKEAIDNIVNDIVANSRTVTSWENSSGLFDYLESRFSDKAYLNKTIDFIISNSKDRLNAFKNNITYLIEEYENIIVTKINIETINIENILKERMIKEEFENIKLMKENVKEMKRYEKMKKESEEKNKKWNKICEEYNTMKNLINSIFKIPDNVQESQNIVEGEKPTPQ